MGRGPLNTCPSCTIDSRDNERIMDERIDKFVDCRMGKICMVLFGYHQTFLRPEPISRLRSWSSSFRTHDNENTNGCPSSPPDKFCIWSSATAKLFARNECVEDGDNRPKRDRRTYSVRWTYGRKICIKVAGHFSHHFRDSVPNAISIRRTTKLRWNIYPRRRENVDFSNEFLNRVPTLVSNFSVPCCKTNNSRAFVWSPYWSM